MSELLTVLMQLSMAVLALSLVLLGVEGTRKWATRLIHGVVRATAGVAILMVFTLVDACITGSLCLYHAGIVQYARIPENWHAFALRFNDRLYRYVLTW